MQANTRYLSSLWACALVMAVLAIFGVGSYLWHGQVLLAVLPIALTILVVIVIRWRVNDRRVRRLLQSESPEDLIAFTKRTIRPGFMRHSDAFLAQACALVYTLYGDYPAAWQALEGADWEQCPPLIGAFRESAKALLCYVETRQYERGLRLARAAQEAGRVAGLFPGARRSAAAFESLVEIGEVLCGLSTDSTVGSLEWKMTMLPTLGRLVVAWGLTIAYRKAGDNAKAAAMGAYIEETAPHCRGLAIPADAEPANGSLST